MERMWGGWKQPIGLGMMEKVIKILPCFEKFDDLIKDGWVN